jgi:MFS family permease
MPSDHRRAFQILFVCLVCVGMGQSMLFAILPPAAREIGLTPFQVSTIFATSACIWVFVSPRWGRQSDYWGRRTVILIGLLGFAASMASLATAIQIGLWKLLPVAIVYPLMVASRCLFALFGSGTGPASQAYVADRTSRAERTSGVAIVNAAMGTGQTLGPAVGGGLAVFGMIAPLYFAAVLAVASALSIWFFLPEEGTPSSQRPAGAVHLSFHDRRVLPFFLVATALQAVNATTTITLAFFFQDTLGLDSHATVQYASAGFVVLAIAGLIAQLVIVRRFKPSPRWMIRNGILFCLAGSLALATRGGFVVYSIALVLLGIGFGLLRPGTAAGASLAVSPEEQGSVAGLTNAIGVLGNVFGPMLGTTLYTVTPIAPALINSVLMIAAMMLVLTSRQVRNSRA